MGTSELIKKIAFRYSAKGRHRVHSPFVYAFVEQVLRLKTSFHGTPDCLEPRAWQQLNAGILYLTPSIVFLNDAFPEETRQSLKEHHPKIRFLFTEHKSLSPNIDKTDFPLYLYLHPAAFQPPSLPQDSTHAIWLFDTYAPLKRAEWTQKAKQHNYPLVLHLWEGCLLIKHPDFRQFQVFRLH